MKSSEVKNSSRNCESNTDVLLWRRESLAELRLKASGGDQVGLSCLRAVTQRSPQVGNQESGNAAGNIGLLPFLTRTTGRLPCCPAAQLRSHSGRNAGVALAVCPTCPEFTIPSHLFRTLILERLCLPLQMTEAHCEGCHAQLDTLGRHRASCARSGRGEEAGRRRPSASLAASSGKAGATVRQTRFF